MFCGGENCFPAAWHNHAVQYNLRRSPAGMFFAGSSGIAKSTVYSLQAAGCVRNLFVAEIISSLYCYLLPFKTKIGKWKIE
jgi:hypothetical protein